MYRFFFYINYKKTLTNDRNIKKLHINFKIITKLSIIIICILENNLLSSFVFFIWAARKFFEYKRKKLSEKRGLPDQKKKETIIIKSITEMELEKLHEYYRENECAAIFKSPSKKRYFFYFKSLLSKQKKYFVFNLFL